jgi:Inner membrane component of T3SS, cytoplasmic domain/Inner membrane component of T3SS, periplasmic domain
MAGLGLMSMSSLFGVVSASSTFVLEITAGVHRGVRLELEPGDCRIGSTSGADIVVRDAGIAGEHAILRVGPRSIDLHAIGGEVRVGGEVIAKGYGCALRTPIDLTIGEARLRISVERDDAPARNAVERGDAPARPRISRAILVAGALLLAVPPLGLAAAKRQAAPNTYDMTAEAPSDVFDKIDKFEKRKREEGRETPTTASLRQPRPNGGSVSTAEEAGRKLSEFLQVSGLPSLRVNASGGQVVVTGSITKQQSAAWTEAQQWFDGAYRGRLVLVSNVTFAEAKPMPVVNVQAVWFGERPYIITAEGTRYYKGSFLDNGWTIKDIADGRILLAKDGETLALVYRQ